MNYVFISPNFPDVYYKFVLSLRSLGVNVFGISDCPYSELRSELQNNLTYYYQTNLFNYESVKSIVNTIISTYGKIDYLESQNEFWLELDSRLRTDFNIENGFKLNKINRIKSKSEEKLYFSLAGAVTPRFIKGGVFYQTLEFIDIVGYPVFVKPDIGVGAVNSFRINNFEELQNFYNNYNTRDYIMEEYVNGDLYSFDGIADNDSNCVVCAMEYFKYNGADIVTYDLDDHYIAYSTVNKELLDIGLRVVKAFHMKKTFFHIEFFKLKENKYGLGSKGSFVALETNMRPPGGNSIDLINAALNINSYDIYAKVILGESPIILSKSKKNFAATSSRKDIYQYKYTHLEIMEKYSNIIFEYGRYNKEISKEMGDTYYYIKCGTIEEVNEFDDYVREKITN